MTQEEKQLLLLDISGRLQSGLKVCYINLSDEMPKVWDLIGMPTTHLADILVEGSHRFAAVNIEENIRPYLRPLSSMTEEEIDEYREIQDTIICQWDDCGRFIGFTYAHSMIEYIDWLNKKMFDYRGLIEKGLALEAPEGMYKS